MAEYRDKYLDWARRFLSRHDPGYRFRWEVYFHELERLLKDADSFLDAGCGDNQTVNETNMPGFKLGVDEVIPINSKDFCCAALERLPFTAASFDVIGCRFVLEHLENPDVVFREFHRILKPGGHLLTQTTNRRHPLILLGRLLPRFMRRGLTRRIYGRSGGTEMPTYHRLNRPGDFRPARAGMVPVRIWHIEDLHLESKFAFRISYYYHLLTRILHRPSWRSSITVLWEKPIGREGV
jgi:SAM-dependent methyltransferase